MTGDTEDWSRRRETLKLKLCEILVKTGAIRFGEFVLASGKLSPYYIDLRLIPSFPLAFETLCDFYIDIIESEIGIDKFDRIASVPVSGLPFGSVVAYKTKKPFLIVRKGVKTHGREKRVEGLLLPANRVLLLDDLITTGKSLMETVEALRAEGGIVNYGVVLIDRKEGGTKMLDKMNVKVLALAEIREIVEILRERSILGEDEYKAIIKQIVE
ncbi:MAG: orotate phosphoribosyltransferase [Candidatus Bathyarchaeia archaeon]